MVTQMPRTSQKKRPNSLEKKTYTIGDNPSGTPLKISVFHLQGKEPGPHVHIQASVHGAELQGNLVIFQLLQYFEKIPPPRLSLSCPFGQSSWDQYKSWNIDPGTL